MTLCPRSMKMRLSILSAGTAAIAGDFRDITRTFAALIRSQLTTCLSSDALTRGLCGTVRLDAVDTKHCIIKCLSLAEGTGFEPSVCQMQLFEYPCVLCLRGSLRLIPQCVM